MKINILKIFSSLFAFSLVLAVYLYSAGGVDARSYKVRSVTSCPDGDGWTKIESSTFYPVAGAVEICFKAGPYVTYEMPEGGFGQPGGCTADNIEGCELSHWSFRIPTCPYPGDGDWAHWPEGWHQIVGGPLLYGSDDVYSLYNPLYGWSDYLQCFCGLDGTGIQTYWWRTELASLMGWFSENGLQWNLGDYHYLAQNVLYDCSN